MRESQLVYSIIKALYPVVHLMRANVGTVTTADGKKFSTGLPKGFPDLFGVLKPECSATGVPLPVFIECKVGYNKPTLEQKTFLERYGAMGCIAGCVWSVEDAWELLLPYIKVERTETDGGETDVFADDRPVGTLSESLETGPAAVL